MSDCGERTLKNFPDPTSSPVEFDEYCHKKLNKLHAKAEAGKLGSNSSPDKVLC